MGEPPDFRVFAKVSEVGGFRWRRRYSKDVRDSASVARRVHEWYESVESDRDLSVVVIVQSDSRNGHDWVTHPQSYLEIGRYWCGHTLGTRGRIPGGHMLNILWSQTTLDHNVPSNKKLGTF